jgi:hypothetical protein
VAARTLAAFISISSLIRRIVMSTVDQTAAQGSAIGAEAARPASINLSSLGVPTSVQGVTAQGPNASPVKYTPALSLERSVESDETLKKHDRSFYVSAFKVGVEKTARATLDMCRVVFEANQVLDAYDFEKFCGEIGIRSGSSTIRKFIAIGRVYPRFINYADQLPIAWTNIYLLTQIPAKSFEHCLQQGKALKDIKGNYLRSLIESTQDLSSLDNRLPYDKNHHGHMFAKVLFTKKIDDVDWRAAEKALNELEARLPIKVVVLNQIASIVEQRKLQRYTQAKKHFKDLEFKPEVWDFGDEANAVLPRNDPDAQQPKAA